MLAKLKNTQKNAVCNPPHHPSSRVDQLISELTRFLLVGSTVSSNPRIADLG